MAWDILDALNNPETLSALMGIPATGQSLSAGAQAQPPPQPPPQAPPQDSTPLPPSNVMASADPNFAPNSTVGANAFSPPNSDVAFNPNTTAPPSSFSRPLNAQPAPPQAAAPGPQTAAAPTPMPAPRPPQPYQVAPSAADLPRSITRAGLDQDVLDRTAGVASGNPDTDKYIHHYAPLMEEAGITPRHVDALRMGVSKIESGGKYGLPATPRNSNFGRFQYNMKDVREVASNVFHEQPPTYAQLMHSDDLQEKYYAGYVSLWHNYLAENSKAYRDADPDKRTKALAAAQMGAHAKDWIEGGSNFRDGNGTHINTWPRTVGAYLGDNPPDPVNGRFSMGAPGTPSPPDGFMRAGAGTPGATGGGLAGSLGLNGGAWQQAAAALGKGLSAVGAQRPGAFGAQSFAAGMGGALTGGVEQQQQQWKNALAENHEFFNQSVAQFDRELAGKAFPYKLGQLKAQADWLEARSIRAGEDPAMAKAKTAWQLSDVGRLDMANRRAQNEIELERKQRKDDAAAGIDVKSKTEEEWNQQKQGIYDKYYKQYNVDPKTAKGYSKENPMDVTGRSDIEMRTMPPGTHYKYKDPKDPKADKDDFVHKIKKQPTTQVQPAQPAQQAGTGDQDEYEATQAANAPVDVANGA